MNATAKFLSRYAAMILATRSTSARCEKTVYRMATCFGYDMDMTILPRSVMMTVRKKGTDQPCTVNEKIPEIGLNFYFISSLSRLSWRVRDDNIGLEETEWEFERIISTKRMEELIAMLQHHELDGVLSYMPLKTPKQIESRCCSITALALSCAKNTLCQERNRSH